MIMLCILTSIIKAQDHYSCNSQRYRLNVFKNTVITKNIQFSIEETIGGRTFPLYMDIYEPAEDTFSKRPLVILAFGGSYINGTRRDLEFMCKRFAKKGYVAVSIDYRLYDLPLIPFPNEAEMKDVVVRSIKDMSSALLYLDSTAKNGNKYGLDMDWVYVGGVSSGAVTANHFAMLDSLNLVGNNLLNLINKHSPIPGISDNNKLVKIRGVINFSGALNDASWIDNNDPPFISFHDDGDPTVPYKNGNAQIFGLDIVYCEGSFTMDSVAKSKSVNSILNTIASNRHISYLLDVESSQQVIDESAIFMFKMICSETAAIEEVNKIDAFHVYPNPFKDKLTITMQLKNAGLIKILDNQGKVIVKTGLSGSTQSFKTSSLPKGVYYLIFNIDGQDFTQTLIKE
jgi:hypothetical protein